MKRMLTLALGLALVLGLALPVLGAENEVVGYALYTEIVAEIDDHPIASYNVAGRTAVMAADLAHYGFYVYWDEEAGVAYIWPGALKPGGMTEETPDYVPRSPEGEVGDPAYPIYASNVKVCVAGEEKESFNIGGHVMVYLSDLSAYGDVAWKAEEKVAALQVAEDPVQLALDRLEAELKESGLSYQLERYPGPRGTLAVYSQGGTPHGSACMMLYVDRSGQQTRIDQLLPDYGFGPQYYLAPRDIFFDEALNQLTFITPVHSQEGDWGDTRCTFDAGTGKIISMVPLEAPLRQWQVTCSSYDGAAIATQQPMYLTVTRTEGAYEASVSSACFPSEKLNVTISSSGVVISESTMGLEPSDPENLYTKVEAALRQLGLPDVVDSDFAYANTDSQRTQADRYFQVTKNGRAVSGYLWWSRGNGHMDLNFTFDESIQLETGDTVALWVGLPGEV